MVALEGVVTLLKASHGVVLVPPPDSMGNLDSSIYQIRRWRQLRSYSLLEALFIRIVFRDH